MGHGYLRANVLKEEDLSPIQYARIILRDTANNVLYDFLTDMTGTGPLMRLNAPDVSRTLDPTYRGMPFSVYIMEVRVPGFHTMIYHGIEIFDTQTATQTVIMHRASADEIKRGEDVRHVIITGTRREQMHPELESDKHSEPVG